MYITIVYITVIDNGAIVPYAVCMMPLIGINFMLTKLFLLLLKTTITAVIQYDFHST